MKLYAEINKNNFNLCLGALEKKKTPPLRIFVHLDDQLLAKFALHEALVQLMRLGNSRAR
jgi:hypothetical protein